MSRNSFSWGKNLAATKTKLPLRKGSLDDFRRIEVVKRWANELKAAKVQQASLESWSLVGHAVIMVTDDVEECRDLMSLVAMTAGFQFLTLGPLEVVPALTGEPIPASVAPCLVYLEPGKWMSKVDKDEVTDSTEQALAFQRHLRQIIMDFDPVHPVVFVTSVENLAEIDQEFRNAGVFDRRIERVAPTLNEVGEDFLTLVGRELWEESTLARPGKVGKLIDSDFDDRRRQGIIAIVLKRIAARERRKLQFIDLVNIAMRGSGEMDAAPCDDSEVLRIIAIHEAGHATLAIIDSKGENIPDYSSAFPSKSFGGIVADSYTYGYARHHRMSYADFRHQIRTGLAGRAAEHVVLGSEQVTVRGAGYDLEKATSLCKAIFGECGISPDMEDPDAAGANLAVIVDEPTVSEATKVEVLTQQFLERQYRAVVKTLEEHRTLLDAITERLMIDRVLDQGELTDLYMAVSE